MDDDAPPCTAEAMTSALAIALLRKGVLEDDDIVAVADDLDARGGKRNEEAAHVLRCTIVEAQAPPASEWKAEQARSRIRLVKDEDGERR